MTILPSEESVDGRVAIPGERVCFLMVPELGPGETISYNIAAVGATLLEVPPTHSPGGVDELCVVPAATQVDTTASVTIDSEVAGPAGSKLRHDVRTIAVVPVPDERAEVARPYFERWVAWLAANRPELGINAATTWQPSYISINIIVTHYAYWNDEWEMVINWHVMVPPSDWSNVFLRRRGVDSGYTIAYHIDSVAGNTEPQAVDPPADLIR